MVRKSLITAVILLIASTGAVLANFALTTNTSAVQSVPYQMNFQGRISDSTGTAKPAGTYNMIFRIYSTSSGGVPIWSETRSVYGGTGVTVTNGGLFSVQLGSVVGLPPAIFNSAPNLYLEVELPTPATATCSTNGCPSYTEGAMTPRNSIASSPYAINTDTLDGYDSSDFALASGSANYIQNQSASPQAASFNISGTGLIRGTSATAFQVQNASGGRIFGVDTSASLAMLGAGSDTTGKLVLYNGTNNNTVTLQSGATSTGYTLTLPTALGSSGQCLSDTTGTGVLGWASCSGGGGGSSNKFVTFTPEYAGAILQADGTNNNGTMTTDFISGLSEGFGYKHNFYQWTTAQATAQDYDIIVTHQLPSDFNATSEFINDSWNVWTHVDNTSTASITMTVYDHDMTACANGVNIMSAGVSWDIIMLDDFDTVANCDFTPNSIITIKIKLSSASPSTNKVRLGEIQYGYAT